MSKYKYWMIQGIRDKKDNFENFICDYDIYPLRSIVDIWYYFKVLNSYYYPGSMLSWLDNFTLILAPKIEDNKIFRKNGTWYIWDYQKNRRFSGSYQEFLAYLDYQGGIKRSDILLSRRLTKNALKLASQPFKP